MSCVTCHVMCHVSHVTCPVSRVNFFFFFFFWTKWWSLSVEGLLSKGSTLSSLLSCSFFWRGVGNIGFQNGKDWRLLIKDRIPIVGCWCYHPHMVRDNNNKEHHDKEDLNKDNINKDDQAKKKKEKKLSSSLKTSVFLFFLLFGIIAYILWQVEWSPVCRQIPVGRYHNKINKKSNLPIIFCILRDQFDASQAGNKKYTWDKSFHTFADCFYWSFTYCAYCKVVINSHCDLWR